MGFGSFFGNYREDPTYNKFVQSNPFSSQIQRSFDNLGGLIFPRVPQIVPYDPPYRKKDDDNTTNLGSCECQKYRVTISGTTTINGNFRLDGRRFSEITEEVRDNTFTFSNLSGPIYGLVAKTIPDDNYFRVEYRISHAFCRVLNGEEITSDIIEAPTSFNKRVIFKRNDPNQDFYVEIGDYSITNIEKQPPIREDCPDQQDENKNDRFKPPTRQPRNRPPIIPPPTPRAPDSNAPPTPTKEPNDPGPQVFGPGPAPKNTPPPSSDPDVFGPPSGPPEKERERRPPPPGPRPKNPEPPPPPPRTKKEEEKEKPPPVKPPEDKEKEIDKKLSTNFRDQFLYLSSKDPQVLGQYFDYDTLPITVNAEGLEGIFRGIKALSLQIYFLHLDTIKSMQPLLSPSQYIPKECKENEKKEDFTEPEGNLSNQNNPSGLGQENIPQEKIKDIDLIKNNLFVPQENEKYLPNFLILKQQEYEIFAQGSLTEDICSLDRGIVSIYAEDALIYPGQKEYLYITWLDVEDYPVRGKDDPIWQTRLPQPITNINWEDHLEPLRWKKGEQHALLQFEGSRNTLKGYFFNKDEANRFFNEMLRLTDLKERDGNCRKYQDTTKRKVTPKIRTVRPYRAYLAFIDDTGKPSVTKCFGTVESQ